MDAARVGRSIRALRRRRGWRQEDLAARCGVSQSAISRMELGQLGGVSVGSLEQVVACLGAALTVELRWHGERLDRLLDETHARLVETTLARLRRLGWEAVPEVSFSIYGERGSIDILAYRPATRSCLVVEVKSAVPDVQAMLAALDRKQRLGRRIAADRGWPSESVSRLLVIRDTTTSRRRLRAHDATFAAFFPAGAREMRRWLCDPGPRVISAIWFLSDTRHAGGGGRIAGRRGGADAPPHSGQAR